MFKQIAKWFKREQLPQVKKIAFIDGDQPLPEVLAAYEQYVANTGTETHLVRAETNKKPPKVLRYTKHVDIIKMENKACNIE